MTKYVLDTDTLSLLQAGIPKCRSGAPPGTRLTWQSQLSAWRNSSPVGTPCYERPGLQTCWCAYQRLAETVRSMAALTVLPFTVSAIARYQGLMKLRLNVRRMDLRIAAIVLENGGILGDPKPS